MAGRSCHGALARALAVPDLLAILYQAFSQELHPAAIGLKLMIHHCSAQALSAYSALCLADAQSITVLRAIQKGNQVRWAFMNAEAAEPRAISQMTCMSMTCMA